MTQKKLAVYSFILAILFLILTFSIVRRKAGFRAENMPERVPEKTTDVFSPVLDTTLSEIQLQKIRPIFGGIRSDYDQEWGRNPFQPFRSQPPITGKHLRKQALRLEGIIQKGKVRKAIISGKILSVGDKIAEYRVKLILENMVALKNGNREIYLTF